MSKKSNVIIGLSVVGIIILGIGGLSLRDKPEQGRSPALTESRAVAVSDSVALVSTSTSTPSGVGSFVASKQGKKYFPMDCGTAKSIKDENKVYFGSESEAIGAGYERSKTCK